MERKQSSKITSITDTAEIKDYALSFEYQLKGSSKAPESVNFKGTMKNSADMSTLNQPNFYGSMSANGKEIKFMNTDFDDSIENAVFSECKTILTA